MEQSVAESAMSWGTVAQWAGATATTAAVLVALFKDEFMRRWWRPVLDASIAVAPPDCHLTKMSYRIPSNGPPIEGVSDCYYFRLWITNTGRGRAEKVQVFVRSLERQRADDKFEPVLRFSPMNLKWSHARNDATFADGISPGMGKHCDLAHMLDPVHRANVGHDLTGIESVADNSTILSLDLEAQAFTRGHLLAEGTYRMTVQIAASNARPVTRMITITFKGTWFEGERDMLSRGIGIQIHN